MTISSDNFVEIFPETQKNNFHIYSPSPFSSFCEKKFQNLKKFFLLMSFLSALFLAIVSQIKELVTGFTSSKLRLLIYQY